MVAGALLGLLGLTLAGLATAAGWAAAQQRDGGFITAPTHRYAVSSSALTTTNLDVLIDDDLPSAARPEAARVMVRATPADPAKPVFIGIAPQAEVAAYLSDVEHSELVNVRFAPFRATYRAIPGSRTPEPPGRQTFWAVSAEGAGTQQVEGALRSGNWAVVVMNADATPQVAADLTVGARFGLLGPIAVGLTVGTILLLGAGVALLVWGASGLGRAVTPSGDRALAVPAHQAGLAVAEHSYPVQLTGELTAPLSRWLWLVKWFLAIPHYVVLAFLWVAFVLTTIIAGFAILFTGRYPRSLFAFNVGVVRWSWRVGFYANSALGTDQYPPFSLARTDYPADFDVDYPQRLSRGLVLVKSWLLAIPHLIIVGLLTAPWYWVANGAPTDDYQRTAGISLLGLLVLVAGLALLFTGRYPPSLFDLIMGINRWVYRVTVYVALMRDEYPPFRLDQGAAEPGTTTAIEPGTTRDGTGSVVTAGSDGPSAVEGSAVPGSTAP
jgi:hypothetical protein